MNHHKSDDEEEEEKSRISSNITERKSIESKNVTETKKNVLNCKSNRGVNKIDCYRTSVRKVNGYISATIHRAAW